MQLFISGIGTDVGKTITVKLYKNISAKAEILNFK
jgi:dethiobiotin synthetase